MREEIQMPSFDGLKLGITVDTPDDRSSKGVIVLAPGIMDHRTRYETMARRFSEDGFKVVRYDLRGHGTSEGEHYHLEHYQDLFDDLNAVVDFTRASDPGLPIFITGICIGGLAAAGFGTKYPNKVNGMVLIAPLVRDAYGSITQTDSKVDPLLHIPCDISDGLCSDPLVKQDFLNDPQNARYYTAGFAQQVGEAVNWLYRDNSFHSPLLLLHGMDDRIVHVNDSADFISKVESTDKQIKLYGSAQHEIFNEPACRKEVIQDILRWINNRLD